jgi:hypothetical protein
MKGKYMNIKIETVGHMQSIPEKEHSCLRAKPVAFAALAVWLGLVSFLGYQGAFVGGPDSPPLGLLLGLAIPLGAFFAAYFGWSEFRAFVLGADLRFIAAMQGWRWAGLGFLTLSAKGILPWMFAYPAGLGDTAIGITAPWIVLGLIRQPSFAADRRYVIWNILGIVDLVVAVSMGVLSSGLFPGITRLNGDITTAAMAHLPLVLVPAYLVPLFMMLHATALFQARQLARSGKSARGFNS